MSVKHYKLALPSSTQQIRKAKASLKEMPEAKKIEQMVAAASLTVKQAERAKKKLGDGKLIE
jgi:hypothetical protein